MKLGKVSWNKFEDRSTWQEYEKVNAWAVSALILLVPFHQWLSTRLTWLGDNFESFLRGYMGNPFVAFLVNSGAGPKIAGFLVKFATLSVLFWVLHKVIGFWNRQMWVRKNKYYYLQGTWATVHVKDNGSVRLGVMEIRQNYYDIEADAKNIWKSHRGTIEDARTPQENGLPVSVSLNRFDDQKVTDWHYYTAKLYGKSKDFIDVVGCYSANKRVMNDRNIGTHLLEIDSDYDSHPYPVSMHGTFADNIRRENVEKWREMQDAQMAADMGDHRGNLYFVKLTPEQAKVMGEGSSEKREMLKKYFYQVAVKTAGFWKEGDLTARLQEVFLGENKH